MTLIADLIRQKKVRTLVKVLFGIVLTDVQAQIVRTIAWEEAPKVTIKAYTQYGKTMCVALGICLHKMTHEGNKYRLIASQDSKTAILRNYVVEFILKNAPLTGLLDLEASGIARLHKEVSRRRLTFKDGDDLIVLSAEGDAMRLMGHGGNIIVVDETGEIDTAVFKEKIMRMTAGHAGNSMIIEIGNPWDPNSHFAEHWDDPRMPEQGGWLKFHIPYQVGVREGRVTQAFIDERKDELRTNPMMFRVLWEAEFPEESEDQLIRREWIESAEKNALEVKGYVKAGNDVAEQGLDETVAIEGVTDGRLYKPLKAASWAKTDTMPTVGKLTQFLSRDAKVNVDSTGVGSGVCSRLKELGYNAYAYKGGSKPDLRQDYERFKNLLAMFYWSVREAFESGRIDLSVIKEKYPREYMTLKQQLLSIRYEIQSDRLIRILKPGDKSPDWADAFSLFVGEGREPGFYIPTYEKPKGNKNL